MTTNFTSALELEGDWHITLCFCSADGKKKKVKTWNGQSSAKVLGVEYWEHVDLTVLIVQSDLAYERHEYYRENGYTYNHEFKPHATVGKGDLTESYGHMVGKELNVIGEYVRLF